MRRVPTCSARDDREQRSAHGTQSSGSHPDAHQNPRVSARRRRRSRSGRALVTYGTSSKFQGGGGDVVYHSSVSATHGSLPTRAPTRVVRTTFHTNTSIPTP